MRRRRTPSSTVERRRAERHWSFRHSKRLRGPSDFEYQRCTASATDSPTPAMPCGCTCHSAPSGAATSFGGWPNARPTSRSSCGRWPTAADIGSRGDLICEQFQDVTVRLPGGPGHAQLAGPVAGRVGPRVRLADFLGLVCRGGRRQLRAEHPPSPAKAQQPQSLGTATSSAISPRAPTAWRRFRAGSTSRSGVLSPRHPRVLGQAGHYPFGDELHRIQHPHLRCRFVASIWISPRCTRRHRRPLAAPRRGSPCPPPSPPARPSRV